MRDMQDFEYEFEEDYDDVGEFLPNEILDDFEEPPAKPDIQITLEALKTVLNGRPNSTVFYGLSGLGHSEIEIVRPVWNNLPGTSRRKIVRELIEVSEANFEMDYRSIGFLALDDPDPGVREAAIEVLWEDESIELMKRLISLLGTDTSNQVRAAAAVALGRFILAGELDSIPQERTIPAQEAIIAILKDRSQPVEVRRRAVEAIANCTHDIVPTIIRQAYGDGDRQMRVSSLFAMGRSCDKQWEKIVIKEIDSLDSELRFEATRAAGELELHDAVPKLGQLTLEDDREIQEIAIWSLGEIGGREALRILEALGEKAEDEEDDDLVQIIEEAISQASLVGGDLLGDWDD